MGWILPRLMRRAYLKSPAGGSGTALRSRFNALQSRTAADARVGLESSHRNRNFSNSPRNCKVAPRQQGGSL